MIVDECGCTQESSTALLLRLKPRNLVLVGDHKQLRPCTLIQPHVVGLTQHDRSLMERCVLASGKVSEPLLCHMFQLGRYMLGIYHLHRAQNC